MEESLFNICQAAGQVSDIKIIIEPLDYFAHKKNTLGTTIEGIQICNNLKNSGLSLFLCLDTAHLVLNGENISDAVKLGGVFTFIITPDLVGGGSRGTGNWQRDVSFVIWTDNAEGNSIIMGETVTPSGNWPTIPPHRHQYDIPDEEVPYEEAYFFQFSKPQGFGLVWQFDDEGEMDQALSIKTNDVIYMDKGYHPKACVPGAEFYQLTIIAEPHRTSKSKVHKDYEFLLEDNNMVNPYARQLVK